ncbi:hypothetical protein pb186bvf_007273 [Paramecium bursaria]
MLRKFKILFPNKTIIYINYIIYIFNLMLGCEGVKVYQFFYQSRDHFDKMINHTPKLFIIPPYDLGKQIPLQLIFDVFEESKYFRLRIGQLMRIIEFLIENLLKQRDRGMFNHDLDPKNIWILCSQGSLGPDFNDQIEFTLQIQGRWQFQEAFSYKDQIKSIILQLTKIMDKVIPKKQKDKNALEEIQKLKKQIYGLESVNSFNQLFNEIQNLKVEFIQQGYKLKLDVFKKETKRTNRIVASLKDIKQIFKNLNTNFDYIEISQSCERFLCQFQFYNLYWSLIEFTKHFSQQLNNIMYQDFKNTVISKKINFNLFQYNGQDYYPLNIGQLDKIPKQIILQTFAIRGYLNYNSNLLDIQQIIIRDLMRDSIQLFLHEVRYIQMHLIKQFSIDFQQQQKYLNACRGIIVRELRKILINNRYLILGRNIKIIQKLSINQSKISVLNKINLYQYKKINQIIQIIEASLDRRADELTFRKTNVKRFKPIISHHYSDTNNLAYFIIESKKNILNQLKIGRKLQIGQFLNLQIDRKMIQHKHQNLKLTKISSKGIDFQQIPKIQPKIVQSYSDLIQQYVKNYSFAQVSINNFYQSAYNIDQLSIYKNITKNKKSFLEVYDKLQFMKNKYTYPKQIEMFIISLLIFYCEAQTTTNVCQNEPLVYKLDIRDRIKSLGDDYNIDDLDASLICQETYSYDYIWFTQLWIPSMYNYKNLTNPEQTDNYREFQSIKEYEFDPQLGTVLQFTSFLQRLKSICYHIKILGEFSFYIGQDSSLLQDKTRFLRRPLTISFNDQNNRYDDNELVWAVNSKGQTIPFTAVWNYFQLAPITDIQDIIYYQILRNHQLDGIVFLQPSLGLYSVAQKFYSQEVQYYGDSTKLNDFYQNIGFKYVSQNYYFMGDLDNVNSKNLLLNAGLAQIYGQPPRSNIWLRVNYTFSPQQHASNMHVDNLICRFLNNNTSPYPGNAAVDQPIYKNSQQCITFNFTSSFGDYYSGTLAGILNFPQHQQLQFLQPYSSAKYGLYTIVANQVLTNFFGPQSNYGAGFQIYNYDKMQISLDNVNMNTLVFRKLETFRFGVGLCRNNDTIEIAFPFHFTQSLKSSLIKINGDRHIESTQDSANLQFAQVFQSINQYEDNTTLNILALNIPNQSIIALGICNKDLMKFNKHQLNQKLNSGGYLYQSNGYLINSNVAQYNNLNSISGFEQGDLISITYIKSNYSIIFKNNNIFIYTMSLGKYVKNLNYCVGFQQQFQSISLEY